MIVTQRTIKVSKVGDDVVGTVYDKYLNDTKKTMFRLVFALAMALKVSPKKLASFFNAEDIDKYARKLNEELASMTEKQKEDFNSKLKKAGLK